MVRGTDFESYYRVLMDISSSVHFYSEVKHVLDILAKKTTEALEAKGALIRIYNIKSHKLEMGAACGLSDRFFSHRLATVAKTAQHPSDDQKVSVITDIHHDPRVEAPREVWAEGIRMIVDAPLTLRSDTLGNIRIYFLQVRPLSEEDFSFIALIAEIGATLIERDRLIEIEKSRYDHLAVQTEKLSALGRMAAGIAHEINNPLGSIMLYSSNLLKKIPKNDSPLKESLEIILQEASRCKAIIQGMLEFSRESQPQMVFEDLNEVVKKTLQMLENEFHLHHILCQTDLEPQLPHVLMDIGQMEQVIVNLLLNAVQAIEKEGVITVRTSKKHNEQVVCLQITDTGCGIEQENVDKVFEPFFSTKPKGTGLGLAVTYGILKKHGGNIVVSSTVKQGSTFTFDLPVHHGPIADRSGRHQ